MSAVSVILLRLRTGNDLRIPYGRVIRLLMTSSHRERFAYPACLRAPSSSDGFTPGKIGVRRTAARFCFLPYHAYISPGLFITNNTKQHKKMLDSNENLRESPKNPHKKGGGRLSDMIREYRCKKTCRILSKKALADKKSGFRHTVPAQYALFFFDCQVKISRKTTCGKDKPT